MKKLIGGLREFKTNYFSSHQELFEQLAHGQTPRVLFIACSDSRIDPNLLTQAGPGELFVIRNAGNMIPPFGAANGGEGATLEYAIQALGVEQIIVCGHSHCGAMKGLLQLGSLEEEMPLVYEWLRHAEATRRLVKENYHGYSKEELLEITIAENVVTQIENLRTYPIVHSRLYQGKLAIYGWVYLIETGEVLAYDPVTHSYMSPQTQLEEPGRPRQYIATGAPPAIACELPYHGNNVMPSPMPPSIPGVAASGQTTGDGNLPRTGQTSPGGISWLPPDQADRIYRGSSAR